MHRPKTNSKAFDRSLSGSRTRKRLGTVMYLTVALIFGAMPWLLWHDLPTHGPTANTAAEGGNQPMLLFQQPDAVTANLRGAATDQQQPQQAAAPAVPVKPPAKKQVQPNAPGGIINEVPPPAPKKAVPEKEEEEEEKEQDPVLEEAWIEEDDDDMVDDIPEAEGGREGEKPEAKGKEKKSKKKEKPAAAAASAAASAAVPDTVAAKESKVLASSAALTGENKNAFVRFAPQDPHTDKALANMRRERVKVAMKRAWDAYHAHAWGQDTLLPLSKAATNRWGSMAMTMLDSLSTLWVMGLKEDFQQARDWIAENLTFKKTGAISVFETNIRALAGLLSAYDYTQDKMFLDKAVELGDLLLPAFDTATGFPINGLVLGAGTHSGSHGTCLAEFGTMQLEFRYLSHVTGNTVYAEKAMHVFEYLHEKSKEVANHGVFKLDFNADSGHWGGDHYSVAARGDSFYEYLLKTWLQGGKKEAWLREMFDESADGIEELLLNRGPNNRLYIANNDNGQKSGHMEHLACFYPGTLALASASLETNGDPALEKRAAHYMDLARELGETCYQFAEAQVTGLAPDSVTFDKDGIPQAADARYILRPEVAESMYYLHLLDGDPKWREYGALMFDAIDTYCRTDEAYAQVRLVPPPPGYKRKQPRLRSGNGEATADTAAADNGDASAALANQEVQLVWQEDEMESFFLAETLKYLYLIQETEPGEVDLSKQVFNTEAHPLRIFE